MRDMITTIKSRISHRLIRVCALAIAICVVNFCMSKKCIACDNCDTSNLFKIEKISKKKNWFFIYASKNDKQYRILSQAPQKTDSLKKYDINNRSSLKANDIPSQYVTIVIIIETYLSVLQTSLYHSLVLFCMNCCIFCFSFKWCKRSSASFKEFAEKFNILQSACMHICT